MFEWLANVSLVWVFVALALLGGLRLLLGRPHVARWPGVATVKEFSESGIVVLALVFLVIRPFGVQSFYISSGSMENTLQVGERILVNKFIYRVREPRRGDVILFRAPPAASPEQKDFVKRVVGLPGDTVEVALGGEVIVNGQPLPEAYLKEPMNGEMEPVTVPAGHYWVMGDNRNDSSDSRVWGPLERARIFGRADASFWPPARVGLIRRP
jgi:signal peptidase I